MSKRRIWSDGACQSLHLQTLAIFLSLSLPCCCDSCDTGRVCLHGNSVRLLSRHRAHDLHIRNTHARTRTHDDRSKKREDKTKVNIKTRCTELTLCTTSTTKTSTKKKTNMSPHLYDSAGNIIKCMYIIVMQQDPPRRLSLRLCLLLCLPLRIRLCNNGDTTTLV